MASFSSLPGGASPNFSGSAAARRPDSFRRREWWHSSFGPPSPAAGSAVVHLLRWRTWVISLERNNRMFNNKFAMAGAVFDQIKEEVLVWKDVGVLWDPG
uniref:Uncharacterized protein n=1 Tax=Leersia perrieri TaxID=77586 RepID=A0A0D9XUR6_9ORYZ